MSQAARVAAYYDSHTELFYRQQWDPEDLHLGLFDLDSQASETQLSPALKRMTHAIVDPARLGPSDRVVDAGCGVGGAAMDIAEWSGCEVVGLTISPVQVDIARRRAVATGVRFEQADCSVHLPLSDGWADAVVNIESACHYADRRRFLDECRRVLRPGGRLVMSDWLAVDGISDADRSRWIAPVCEAWRLADLETLASYRTLLAQVGFQVVEAQDFGEAVLPNARILQQAWLGLMLAGAAPGTDVEGWKAQYHTLAAAWMAGRFTIGRILAIA